MQARSAYRPLRQTASVTPALHPGKLSLHALCLPLYQVVSRSAPSHAGTNTPSSSLVRLLLTCPFSLRPTACYLSAEQGELYGTGVNTDGQLGAGDAVDRRVLSKLELPDAVMQGGGGVASVHAGADTSAIITRTGELWTFGNSVSPG